VGRVATVYARACLAWSAGRIQHHETVVESERRSCHVFTQLTVHVLLPSLRLRTRMRPHVLHQDAGHRERLTTRLADMRPLPRMCPHVHSQVAGRRARLAARLADMYPCTTCGKASSTSSDLAKHMRTHTGDRPYAYDIHSRRYWYVPYVIFRQSMLSNTSVGTLKIHFRSDRTPLS
jgi:Zinc finger, C2H2 type